MVGDLGVDRARSFADSWLNGIVRLAQLAETALLEKRCRCARIPIRGSVFQQKDL